MNDWLCSSSFLWKLFKIRKSNRNKIYLLPLYRHWIRLKIEDCHLKSMMKTSCSTFPNCMMTRSGLWEWHNWKFLTDACNIEKFITKHQGQTPSEFGSSPNIHPQLYDEVRMSGKSVCLSGSVNQKFQRRKNNWLMNRLRLFVCPGGGLKEKIVAAVCWNWEEISIRRGERCKVRLNK